ncbi:MAG: prepilin-type N-terminal cleavage/methylation domain-containing protein [Syntrophomonadaceae bacterium]|jgi:prepilin-type N-terminal cleavage/methylation domain-containing protein|nr:prepilin-type N-terminal cleavage/methylation domain-containing protein [Syntrophomonadaceae bacterium]
MLNNKGMTAVEVLLALALSSIIISLLFMIFYLFTNAYKINITAIDAQYNARMVATNINKDIRSAKQIALIGDRRIVITGETEKISYYLERDTVYRHSETKIPIAEKVAALSFNQQENLISFSVTSGLIGNKYTLNAVCSNRIIAE